jgi:hypothetical protein
LRRRWPCWEGEATIVVAVAIVIVVVVGRSRETRRKTTTKKVEARRTTTTPGTMLTRGGCWPERKREGKAAVWMSVRAC